MTPPVTNPCTVVKVCATIYTYTKTLVVMLYLHTRDTKFKSQTHSSCIDHMIKLQIQTHSSCFTCTHELQIQTHPSCFTCTHGLQIERKESLSLHSPSYELCNDKRQNDQEVFGDPPNDCKRILRVVFLYIDPFLLTTESEHLDISHMSTHPQEPLIPRRG